MTTFKEPLQIRIAGSNDDKCIKRLAYILEDRYPDIAFDLDIGHTSIIYAPNNDDPKLDSIVRYCEGYVDGWEMATE
jgi:hypothetical protein